ncbi:MAG: gas vesicle protein [Chloroflexi bacterium]|nr:gas vesicle protein [Chloroflexota bacterium]
MNAEEIGKKAQEEFTRLSRLPAHTVIGLSRADSGWTVLLEAVERKAIPDTMDVLGVYEVCMDCDGALIGFARKKLRKRGETEAD